MNARVDELLDQLSPQSVEVAPNWHEVLATARVGTNNEAAPRTESRWGARNAALTLLGVAVGATALSLLLIAPWRIAPSIVDRALAALAIKPSTILHLKYVTTPDGPGGGSGSTTVEAWIGPEGQFRAIIRPGLFGGAAWEVGARAGKMNLRFKPTTNTLTNTGGQVVLVHDIAASIPDALASGTSTVDGVTTLAGRRVERIRTYRRGDCTGKPKTTFLYVDPHTYYPVEFTGYQYEERIPGQFRRWRITRRFLAYEYLPATQRNLELTNIEAEHPHSKLEGSPNIPFNWTPLC